MKKLKPGTNVRLTKEYTEWLSEYADDGYGYPHLIKHRVHTPYLTSLVGDPQTVAEQLSEYFMNRYSYNRGLSIDGVIIGDNGYNDQDFAYLVWTVNELGEDLCYVEPENLEVL